MVVDTTAMTEKISIDRARGNTRPWLRSSTDEAGIGLVLINGTPTEIDLNQAWFWTDEWQAGEREVDELIRNGEVEEYDSLEDLFDSL